MDVFHRGHPNFVGRAHGVPRIAASAGEPNRHRGRISTAPRVAAGSVQYCRTLSGDDHGGLMWRDAHPASRRYL